MKSIPRAILAAAFAAFLIWQAAAAVVALVRETAAVPARERRRALEASVDARIEGSVEWTALYRALEAHVPEESIVAFSFKLDPATFTAFYHVVPLVYPRRAVPVNLALPAADVEKLANVARQLERPSFVVDLESGFALPERRSRVAEGPGFAIWRIER
jgi:hypothetical protein